MYEARRPTAPERYALLDAVPDVDQLLLLTAQIFQTSMVVVFLTHDHRPLFSASRSMEREQVEHALSFCTCVSQSGGVLVIPDTALDLRFQDAALMTKPPGIRFCAGAPLITPEGYRLGALCVLDTVPREPLSLREQQSLRHLAASVIHELELHLALIRSRRLEAVHEGMLTTSPDAVLMLDAQGVITEWNISAERLFRYTREEVLERSILDLIQDTMGPEVSQRFWTFVQTQPTRQLGHDPVETVRLRDGQMLPVETTVLPLEVDGARVYALIVRDRTQQATAQLKLVTQRNLLQAALDGVPEVVYVKDLDRRYRMINTKGATLIGQPVSAILGCTDEELCPPHLASVIRAHDEQVLRTGQATSFTPEAFVLQDRRQMFRSIRNVYRDAAGQVAGLTGLVMDVTEQQAAEDIIREHNAQLIQQVQTAQLEILERLARAAEYRDDDTGEHMHRVGWTSAGLATALGLPADQVELIRRTAPLHDVGKIGISDSILLKPGRLTPEEFEVVKSHSRIGAEILQGGCSPLVRMAETIACTHHERWDGTGYPAGLAGEEIPVAGRIVAVADVLDALLSERPYKRAWSLEAALVEITAQAGRQFDPQVVDALRRLYANTGSEKPVGQVDEGVYL